MNFSNEEIDKLFNLYNKKDGLFAKYRFKMMLKRANVEECISSIKNKISESSRKIDISDYGACVIFIKLLNNNSIKEIENMLNGYKKAGGRGMANETDLFTKEMFNLVGLNYPRETNYLNISFPVLLLKKGIGNVDKLTSLYGDSIIKTISENPIYSNMPFWYTKSYENEINNYQDFVKSRSEGKDYFVVSLFNRFMNLLLNKYTTNELINNSEVIKKELEKGLTYFLPDLDEEKNVFSNNRELFHKIIDHFDSETFMKICNIKPYLMPIMQMIRSHRLDDEDIDTLKYTYDFFYKLNELVRNNKFEDLLSFIEKVENEDESKSPFYEIVNDLILNYETLLRKEIVNNAKSYDSYKEEVFGLSCQNGEVYNCKCVFIDKVSDLEFSLIHMFDGNIIDNNVYKEFAYCAIETVANHVLNYHTRSKEDLKKLIVELFEIGKKYEYTSRNINFNTIKEEVKKLLTEEEYVLVEKEFDLYINEYRNYAEVNQITKRDDTLYNFLKEETSNFEKPLLDGTDEYEEMNRFFRIVYSQKDESILATQILRLDSFDDFRHLLFLNDSNPYQMALSFDGNSLQEESIMISSTDNIETNNRKIQEFDDAYPLNRRSATLDMLESTVGRSTGTHRINNEIDLVRSSVNPKTLLFFFRTPIDDKVMEGLQLAEDTAKKSNLKLVLVDYYAILRELKSREERDNSYEQSNTYEQNEEEKVTHSK